MKKRMLILGILALILSAVLPAFADSGSIWPSVSKQDAQQGGSEASSSAPESTAGSGSSIWDSIDLSKGTAADQAIPVQAAVPEAAETSGEVLIHSNFNSDPVKNHPDHYSVMNIREDQDRSMALVQRIRTHHWNNGNGAAPGTITVYEDGEKIGTWQAVGRSAYGVPNVYWEALVDFILYPGHSYYVAVSDVDSMSYNEASDGCGMFELYGLMEAPAGYVPSSGGSTSQPAVAAAQSPAPAPQSAASAPVPQTVSVGQTFTMGRYEQDNNTANGPEAIQWQVLTVQGDRALVVSKYVLDVRAYHNAGSTWEGHKDRKWLNEDFYYGSFTDAERARILLVTNENPDNPTYGTKGGSRTQDRIFYLSLDEARFFTSDENRKGKPTAYTAAQGILVMEPYGGTTYWSLRSPGYTEAIRAYVDADGVAYPTGLYLPEGYQDPVIGARPAFWLKTAVSPTPTPQACFRVRYKGNDCLAEVPTDSKCYRPGDTVTVLFEPVEYMQSMIFNGWDRDGDGVADHGYYYNSFVMPAHDVELIAICYRQQYQDHYNNQYYDVTPGEVYPDYPYTQNNQYINNDIYDPNTGWWFDPGSYYDFYDGVG